jgi:hypothetical protein
LPEITNEEIMANQTKVTQQEPLPVKEVKVSQMKKIWNEVSGKWHKLQSTILWALIFIIIGMSLGMKASDYLYKQKFEEARNLGGIIYDNKVYDFTYKKDIK